ncbi:bifunctional 4-hydroxy-2-oxoglutarate aldolase/2-dehydro-3-deoxy-phosphogluconate aldolase [Streptomyces diastaticus]|uniref:bifunctional 4-hydroxy-2-oxoglutarate aldolase/2-dehydro-3-deoxy-phosphogluconate aldolase n=1 Tax=Streptomyces diastaticus TaxID=1956 RepID=UPI00381002B8
MAAGRVRIPDRSRPPPPLSTSPLPPSVTVPPLGARLQAGLPHLPGVSTPTEVGRARRRGLHWVKAFPASSLGPSWIRAVRAPFPRLRVVATGGLDLRNASAFLEAGARVVALGSALGDPAQLDRLVGLLPGEPG